MPPRNSSVHVALYEVWSFVCETLLHVSSVCYRHYTPVAAGPSFTPSTFCRFLSVDVGQDNYSESNLEKFKRNSPFTCR